MLEQLRIQAGFVTEDEAVAREALHPREHCRRGQRNRLGQLQVGDAAVFLQVRQDAAIHSVKVWDVGHGVVNPSADRVDFEATCCVKSR
jgi:hypothetical protein